MPKFNAIEGFGKCYGVNTRSILPVEAEKFLFMSRAVNRSTEDMYNGTRPPFTEISIKFQSTEEENTFRTAAISGMKFYEGEQNLFSSFLIVAVGDIIFAGYIRANFIEMFTIYKGINPKYMFSFFGKALNILTWNNSNDPPLYWTGDITTQMQEVYKSKKVATGENPSPMKVSNLSVFAHGRFHVATKENLVYSSDPINDNDLSLEGRETVLRFTESDYPSSGDGFGAPAEQGQITGMIALPKSDQINGHGDLMVACRNGFFSISPGDKVRNQWTDDPSMQKIVFTGKGCAAHQSLVSWGNQIYYRDANNQISSLNYDVSAYQRQGEFDNISEFVNKYLGYDDNSSDIQFCSGFTTAKRLFMTTGHMRETSKTMGIHRYANGIISACLQKRENGSALSWEGIWTGPRPVAAVMTNVGGYKRTIVASYDTDGRNRLYYIDENSKGNDFIQGEYRAIESKFSYSSVFFDSGQNTPLVKKKLQKIESLLIQSNPRSITATYNTNGTEEVYPIEFQSTEIRGCGLTTMVQQSKDIVPAVEANTRNTGSNEGYFFTVNFTVVGIAKFAKTVMAGSVSNGEGFDGNLCGYINTPSLSIGCGTKDCSDSDFTYQF